MAVGQDILLKGIELCQVGRKRHAGRLFVDLLRQEPNNEQAWWWLAACVDTEQQKRECFERLLNINPNHHDARAALRALSAGQPGRVDGTRSSATGGPQPRADLPAESPQNISEVPVSGPNVVEMLPRIRTAPLNAMYRWDAQYEEILDAAQTSEATQDYSAAYIYYAQVLQIDNLFPEGWLGKGFAAGMLSSASQNRVREFLSCMQRGILALEPPGTQAAQAAARMDPALRRAFLDRLLRLCDYINLLAGRCAPEMANIYLVELVELADWAYHFSQQFSVRDGRLCNRADLISIVIDAYQRIAVNVLNTTRGPRARRELLATFCSLLLNNLKLSGLTEDIELTSRMDEIQSLVEA
jgi:tetratricopeptide (TPR) repeat protein